MNTLIESNNRDNYYLVSMPIRRAHKNIEAVDKNVSFRKKLNYITFYLHNSISISNHTFKSYTLM